jgi:predicted lipid-binding transport protein (Tim44 family)
MKKLLVTMMLAITAMSMIAEATARPMGGGRSFGRQSQSVSKMRTPAPPPAAPAAQPGQAARPAAAPAAPVPQPRPSMWKGLLGGALLGLGLGALFSHLGIGGAMASMLSSILMIALLALAVVFVVRMFRRKDTPANSPLPAGFSRPVAVGPSDTPEIGSGLNRSASQPGAFQPSAFQGGAQPAASTPLDKGGAPAHAQWGVPADFDVDAFLRHAKSSFIRLQAAWDKGDVADLREFTTPEVFAELKMQIQERGGKEDFTDVVSIDAQLLGIEETDTDYLASVQFSGTMRDAPNAPAEPFVEVWNMAKPKSGNGGWVLAGIQQLS